MERNRRSRFDRNFGEDFEDENLEFNEEKNKNILKIGICVIIFILLISFIVIMYKKYNENKKNKNETVTNFVEKKERKLQEKYYGFDVEGKIYIDKIKYEDFFVEENVNAINSAISILSKDGVIGGYGNLVLLGHNKKEFFGDLEKLNQGDEIVIENIYGNKTKYIVKTKKEIDPTDLNDLVSDNSKKELTLITCTKDEAKRLEIKCEAK